MINAIVDRVAAGVAERMNPLPTVPETEPESPAPPVGPMAQIPPPPDQNPIFDWEEYIPHRTGIPADYYVKKLAVRFTEVNGPNRFHLLKRPTTICIIDGQQTVFRCRRHSLSNQRNLYLEFHECGYNCEEWMARFLHSHTLDYANMDSPPLYS
jgi:hypothetical protein